jgi:hypothetical protein
MARVASYQDQGAPALRFSVVATPGWTSTTRAAADVIAIGVFCVALILLINGHLLWESLSRASRD